MSTTTETQCTITGGEVTCPADTSFKFGDLGKYLDADIICPLNSVDQTQFRDMSQKGLCTCSATLQDIIDEELSGEAPEPLNCDCYVCPEGMALGFGYVCDAPIFNDCMSFNCKFECNGIDELNTLIAGNGPTAAPVNGNTSAAVSHLQAPVAVASMLLVWALRR